MPQPGRVFGFRDIQKIEVEATILLADACNVLIQCKAFICKLSYAVVVIKCNEPQRVTKEKESNDGQQDGVGIVRRCSSSPN